MSTFQLGSGREALAPLCSAALENRAAGAGRHPRTEPVPALPTANVRLEGAFHEARSERGVCGRRAPARASIEKSAPRTVTEAAAAHALCAKIGPHEIHRPKAA